MTNAEATTGTCTTGRSIAACTLKCAIDARGYTTCTGTITQICMNGSSKGTSGAVDLGTVITSHQTLKTVNGTAVTGSGNVDPLVPMLQCDYDALPATKNSDNVRRLIYQ